MTEETNRTDQPFYQKWWFWTLAVLLIIIILVQGNGEDNEVQNDQNDTDETEIADDEIDAADDETEETTEELVEASEDLDQVTDTEQLTRDEEEYVNYMINHTEKMSNVFMEFSDLLSATDRYYSDDWITEVALQLLLMEQYANEAMEMDSPSERFNQAHDYYIQAMEQYLIVATEFPEAFDNNDADHMDRLIGNIEQGNEYMGMATEEITEIG